MAGAGAGGEGGTKRIMAGAIGSGLAAGISVAFAVAKTNPKK
jgi:hypothetical protein